MSQRLRTTPVVKKIMKAAKAIATQTGSRYVGSDHLLIAMIRTEGTSKKILEYFEVREGTVRRILHLEK